MRVLGEVQKPPFGIQPHSEFGKLYFFQKAKGKIHFFFVSSRQMAKIHPFMA